MSSAASPRPEAPDIVRHVGLDVRPVAGRIGAEVRGLRLSGLLAPEVVADLHQALLRHRVLFLRGQYHLDDAEHEAVGRLFGEIEPHPILPSPGGSRLIELDSQQGWRANTWRTDVSFQPAPPKLSILRAVLIPPVGGDTIWANTVAACAQLPAELKALAQRLWAVHANVMEDTTPPAPDESPQAAQAWRQAREAFSRTRYETLHPVVTVHPETGEHALLLGAFAQRLADHSPADSQLLLALLNAHLQQPDHSVRWRWTTGDVALCDNRATAHYTLHDHGDAHRLLRRVTVSGQPLQAVDGRLSQVLTSP